MFNALKHSLSPRGKAQVDAEPVGPVELRMADRKDVFADAVLNTSIGEKKQGIVLDMSQCGARLRFVTADSVSEGVQVEIPRLRLKRRARVRWKTRTDLGIEFID